MEGARAPGTRPDPSREVHVGQDGWLFLVRGSNAVLEQYRRGPRAWWSSRRWRRLVAVRSRRAAALGGRYLHLVVPDKLTVYDDRVAGLPVDVRRSPARRLARAPTPPGLVDAVEPMRAVRGGPDLFLRTDTHPSFAGNLLLYGQLCRAAGTVPVADFEDRRPMVHDAVRDLGGKLSPPVTETAHYFDVRRDAVRVDANALVRAYEAAGRAEELHTGARVVFRNAAARDDRTVVLFGDSAAHFAPFALTGMLAETYRELHFAWSAGIDWAYVARIRPALVIGEIVERFMARVPDDRVDLAALGARRLARSGLPAPPPER